MKLSICAVALCLTLLCGPGRSEELGRLFFTPQERADLDRRGVQREPAASQAPAETTQVRLDGIVRRSDGSATVWLNGRPAPPSGARRFADGTGAKVLLPDGRLIELKVGDSAQVRSPGDPPSGASP